MIKRAACFECGDPAEHKHHVLPRGAGGKKTIDVCVSCHEKIHNAKFSKPEMIKVGIAKRKSRGLGFGRPRVEHDMGMVRSIFDSGLSTREASKILRVSKSQVARLYSQIKKSLEI
jgi:hypothetical protein